MESNPVEESSEKELNLPRNLSMNEIKELNIPPKKTERLYLTWVNKSNNCWLNSSLAIIAHNTVLKNISGRYPDSRINAIITCYENAMSLLNSSVAMSLLNSSVAMANLARCRLETVQIINSNFLKPILKYQIGDPESAFCCLYNILKDDVVVRRKIDITYIFMKNCPYCKAILNTRIVKPVLTLSKVAHFDPVNPVTITKCSCSISAQRLIEIKIAYVAYPPCIIFHFENGAGNEMPPFSFTALEREYHLTSLMILEKSSKEPKINHFITYIRDPFENKWLDCNDLNLDIMKYSSVVPDFKFEDICMCVYESYDDLGILTDNSYKDISSNKVKELIDLSSDEEEDCMEPKELSPKLQDNALSENLDAAGPSKVPVLTSEKIIHSNVKQSLEKNEFNETNDKNLKNEEPKVESVHIKENNFKTRELDAQNTNLCSSTKQTTEEDEFSATETPESSEVEENCVNIAVNNDNIMNEKSSENLDLTKDTVLQKTLDDNLTLCSKSEDKEAFLSNAATNSSGTSYVKLSLRRKKNSAVQFGEKKSSYCKRSVDTSSSLKFARNSNDSKRQTAKNEDCDYVPSNIPKKTPKKRKILKAKRHSMETDSIEDESKFMNPDGDFNVKKRKNAKKIPRLFLGQGTSADSNVKSPKDRGGKVLEGFEKVWPCHDTGCNCNSISDADRIDSVIKYSFAYFCKLSQEVKNSNK